MLISVVIPVYNRQALILEALQSVVEQTHRPVEVIVVDDGSSDNSVATIRRFREDRCEDALAINLVEQKNAGSVAARNRGIREGSGDFFLFLDSDDVLTRGGLSELVAALAAEEGLDFAYGKVLIGDENLQSTGVLVGRPAEDLLEDPVTYHWHTMAALYRRELVTASGGWDQTADGSDDWVFQSRIKFAARQGRFVDTTIGVWREHVGERLGATSFRESYTVDVTKSCISIYRQWAAADRLTSKIQRRLYFRTLRHSWEIGCFGSRAERDAAFLRVREIGRNSMTLGSLTSILKHLPGACDCALYGLTSRSRKK